MAPQILVSGISKPLLSKPGTPNPPHWAPQKSPTLKTHAPGTQDAVPGGLNPYAGHPKSPAHQIQHWAPKPQGPGTPKPCTELPQNLAAPKPHPKPLHRASQNPVPGAPTPQTPAPQTPTPLNHTRGTQILVLGTPKSPTPGTLKIPAPPKSPHPQPSTGTPKSDTGTPPEPHSRVPPNPGTPIPITGCPQSPYRPPNTPVPQIPAPQIRYRAPPTPNSARPPDPKYPKTRSRVP